MKEAVYVPMAAIVELIHDSVILRCFWLFFKLCESSDDATSLCYDS